MVENGYKRTWYIVCLMMTFDWTAGEGRNGLKKRAMARMTGKQHITVARYVSGISLPLGFCCTLCVRLSPKVEFCGYRCRPVL